MTGPDRPTHEQRSLEQAAREGVRQAGEMEVIQVGESPDGTVQMFDISLSNKVGDPIGTAKLDLVAHPKIYSVYAIDIEPNFQNLQGQNGMLIGKITEYIKYRSVPGLIYIDDRMHAANPGLRSAFSQLGWEPVTSMSGFMSFNLPAGTSSQEIGRMAAAAGAAHKYHEEQSEQS